MGNDKVSSSTLCRHWCGVKCRARHLLCRPTNRQQAVDSSSLFQPTAGSPVNQPLAKPLSRAFKLLGLPHRPCVLLHRAILSLCVVDIKLVEPPRQSLLRNFQFSSHALAKPFNTANLTSSVFHPSLGIPFLTIQQFI